MNIRRLFQRYPIASYFLLAYLISWGGSFAFGGQQFLRKEPMEFEQARILALIVLAGPLTAGLLSTYIQEGRGGLRSLFSRMFKWRNNIGWYGAALLIFPILILAVLGGLSTFVSSDFTPNFFAFGILGGLMAGFIEEAGWTGYAYPKMQEKYGTLRATILLGLLHGVWHIAPDVVGGSYYTNGAFWLPRFVAMWMVAMLAMRVILVWVYTNTGSLLLAQLTHASSTGFLIILSPSPITPANEAFWYVIYAVVIWVAAGVILARYGKNLLKKPRRLEVARSSAG
jgi:membrane protease YdiL (CAAX protease family)